MRIEIVIIIIGSLFAYHVYTEGQFLKKVLSYKKYFMIGAIVVGSLFLCWLFRRNPSSAIEMLHNSNEYLKYLPVDGGASKWVTPILDFTLKKQYQSWDGGHGSFANVDGGGQSPTTNYENLNSIPAAVNGVTRTKRSVSESRKRFVASQQNWLCKKCGEMLPATYEIDHVIRLDRGGTNEISNLAALCPSCHRQKTLLENL